MENDTTPAGQIALRLERLSDAGLTHVSVSSESVVTARYEFSATNYYEFILAPLTDSSPSFFWYEVEIDADGRLCEGEWGGLRELQATAEIIGFGADEWDDAVAALVGIQEAAGQNIAEAAAAAAEEASYVAAELLNELFAAPAEIPPVPDEDEAMGAFKRACERGPRRWDGIALGWDASFDCPPSVTFGKSSSQSILSKARSRVMDGSLAKTEMCFHESTWSIRSV